MVEEALFMVAPEIVVWQKKATIYWVMEFHQLAKQLNFLAV